MNSRKFSALCARSAQADMTRAFGGVLALLEIAVQPALSSVFRVPFQIPSAGHRRHSFAMRLSSVLLWIADATGFKTSFAGNSRPTRLS